MTDMAPPFPRRPLAPFALALGLHLLLVLAWMTGASRGLPRAAPEPASSFVLVRAAPAPQPKPALSVAPPPSRARARLPVVAQAPLPAPAATETSEPVQATTPSEAAAAIIPGELLATSKRMAGAVDRELRNGSSPITAEPDRKWERFAAAFAAARTSVNRDTTLESYTAADGVIIYRKTVGNRVACHRSGSVGGLGPADGRTAGKTSCPSGASWTRH